MYMIEDNLIEDFRQTFKELKKQGASVRQLQRLTGIDRGRIQRA